MNIFYHKDFIKDYSRSQENPALQSGDELSPDMSSSFRGNPVLSARGGRHKKASPKVRAKFDEKLSLFSEDEFNPTLSNHPLKGNYKGYRSINITGDIRAIFERIGSECLFIKLDSHSNLYK